MTIWQCTNPKCYFVFNEKKEDQKFDSLPEDWVCPNPKCRSNKDSFSEIEEEHIGPADEEKTSGALEDKQDIEKKQDPEDEQDIEKKQDPED